MIKLKGRNYSVDEFGVVTQMDHKPYVYDPDYSAIYDREEYKIQSDLLQAMRLGFVCAAHGGKVRTLMDVGYGNGAFIMYAKKYLQHVYGFDVTGVDLPGVYIMPEFIKADIYCFWDVLEHFADCSFLRNLPCETICISLPYCHFLTEGFSWMETHYKHLKPDEHIRHFNELSLKNFMQSYGWRCVAISGHEDIVRRSAHGLQNILTMAFKR